MTKILDYTPEIINLRRNVSILDDCVNATTGGTFTHLVADSGSSIAVANAAGGVLTFTTGATLNNECSRYSTESLFLPANNLPLAMEAREKFTENATNLMNVFVGFSSAFGANLLVDSGAGPATSMSAVGFYKISASTTWNVLVSLGSTQTLVALTAANSKDKTLHTSGGGTYQKLKVEINPISTTFAQVLFYIDDVLVYSIAEWTYTSVAQMGVGTYIKAGGSGGEVLSLDYLWAQQARIAA